MGLTVVSPEQGTDRFLCPLKTFCSAGARLGMVSVRSFPGTPAGEGTTSEEVEITPDTHHSISTFHLSRIRHSQISAPGHPYCEQTDCHSRINDLTQF